MRQKASWMRTFLLTRPLRDVTFYANIVIADNLTFLLTRPLRDVTRIEYVIIGENISTHTPLAGRDREG